MTEPSTADVVLTRAEGAVFVITLNRPQARNAINQQLADGLSAAIDQLDSRDDLRVGVLVGAGSGFSAGMDLRAFLDGQFPATPERGFGGLVARPPRKPLLAAVEGFALAGGLELALACDLILAAEGAKLGIPETALGLFAGAGALLRLPRRVGLGAATRLALTGQPVESQEALRLGLVDMVTPVGGALGAALEMARVISRNGPRAIERSKQLLRDSWNMTEPAYWDLQQPLLDEVFLSAEAREGALAVLERRAPSWRPDLGGAAR